MKVQGISKENTKVGQKVVKNQDLIKKNKKVRQKQAINNFESKKHNDIEKKQNNAKTIGEQEKISGKTKLLLCVCGALIGIVNGFFGGGGGMICVPLLEKVLHLENKYSHATAIVVILPISFVSAVIYLLSGNLESISFLTVGSGVLLGGIVGAFLLKFLPSKTIRIIFVFVMLAGGIRLLF